MKLIILQGPPACGKSTWVKDYLDKCTKEVREKTVVVSRDTIRLSTGTYWVPSREDYITTLEDAAMEQALSRGLDVINDATNLNPKTIKHLEDIAGKFNAAVEYVKLYIPFKEAVERDRKRGENGGLSVTKKVIERFYKMYFPDEFKREMYIDDRKIEPYKNQLADAVICDLDGTVALHTSGRSPYEYDRCDEDTPCWPMVETLKNLYKGCTNIFFVTGREESCRKKTHDWINKYMPELKDYALLMRKEGDRRPGDVFKKEIYEYHIKGLYNVIHVFDDSTKCVKMYRQLGLQCSQVYDFDMNLDNDYKEI